MKAALGECKTVRVSKDMKHIYLTVRLPANCYLHACRLFRGNRVLVTLAAAGLEAREDGIVEGTYRPEIPTLHDVVQEGPDSRINL